MMALPTPGWFDEVMHMKTVTRNACAVVALVAIAAIAGNAFANGKDRIGRAKAEQIALSKAPGGTIKSAEFEHEKNAWVWSFDIKMPGTDTITEVLVDAGSGKVVEVAKETPRQQKDEARQDALEKKRGATTP